LLSGFGKVTLLCHLEPISFARKRELPKKAEAGAATGRFKKAPHAAIK
jgi:hypothetical protein